MRLLTVALTLLFAVAFGGNSRPPYDATTVIAYAKRIEVAKLDPVLPKQSLDEWLRRGPAHLDTIMFHLSEDCDTKHDPGTDEPRDGWPLCVRANFEREHAIVGWVLISVGTSRKGIHGQPEFKYAAAHLENRLPLVGEVERKNLSGVPTMLDRLSKKARTSR